MRSPQLGLRKTDFLREKDIKFALFRSWRFPRDPHGPTDRGFVIREFFDVF